MNTKHKITIVGPIPRDHITTADNEEIVRYGCITNATVALSRLLGDNAEIIPMTHVRKNDTEKVKELFSSYGNVNTSYITSEHDQGAVFDLLYLNNVDKVERQTGYMNPFLPQEFDSLLDSDIFIFTPCTDYELPLETLRYIKQNSKAKIIFSVHGQTTTVNMKGARQPRFWVDRDLWLPYIDIVMMNLKEAGGCWFQKEFAVTELDAKREFSPEEAQPMAHHFLHLGVKAIFITSLDSLQGIFYHGDMNSIQAAQFSVENIDRVVDTTGCAESFAAGLAYGVLKDENDYAGMAWSASKLAALRNCSVDLDAYVSSEEMEEMRLVEQ